MKTNQTIQSIIDRLEEYAPKSWQEGYDNSGIQVGDATQVCTGVLIALDITEEVVAEALQRGANLIISHHPLLFKGLKSITGRTYTERIVIEAIRYRITIYSIHTNIDKVAKGVSGRMADRLGLINRSILVPDTKRLIKLIVFTPSSHRESLLKALHHSGAGQIGAYDSCAYWTNGQGQFRPQQGANPAVGTVDQLEQVAEDRVEIVFPDYLTHRMVQTLKQNHPYEQPAFDLIRLENTMENIGLGIIGELAEPMPALECLKWVKQQFGATVLRHSPIHKDTLHRIAVAGGSCGEEYTNAKAQKADLYITGEVKYHDFFNHEQQIIIADIGHFESEYYTNELIMEIVTKKNCTFAVYMSEVNTNPIGYII